MELKTTVCLEEERRERDDVRRGRRASAARAPAVPVALRVLCPPALGVKVSAVTLWNMCKGRGIAARGIERGGGLRGVGGGGGRWGSAVSVT